MVTDRDIGGNRAAFPATRASVILATGSPDPEIRKNAFENLVAAYWKPIYKYIRVKGLASHEDAKDLTQAFFTRALEKTFFARYDPALAKFRTFLRTCVNGFMANERLAAARLKRGGEIHFVTLDFDSAEGELRLHPISDTVDPDEFFHQEWIRGLVALAVDDLRQWCETSNKKIHFALFERYDLDGPDHSPKRTYAQLAEVFGLPTTQVTNYLALARGQFRKLFLELLRSATSSEEEFRLEAQRLFGSDPG